MPFHSEWGWWWLVGSIWTLVFWVGVVALVVWAVRRLSAGDRSGEADRRKPLDIARERYARGEISKEEFEQLKKDLS